jgi:drug/metabolite transporter (DMT)-like permease
MFSGGFLLLLLSAAAGEFRRLPPTAILLSPRVLVSMAYLVVAASIVAYTAYVWIIAHDSPTRVSSYAYVNPVFALILGAVLAGERLAPLQLAGAALVLAGVLATLMGKPVPAPKAQSAEPVQATSTAR